MGVSCLGLCFGFLIDQIDLKNPHSLTSNYTCHSHLQQWDTECLLALTIPGNVTDQKQGQEGIRRVSAFNLTFLKKFTQYDLKAFSLYLSGFVPIFMGSSPHLASHKRSSLCSVRGTGKVRFLFTTPNQNMFLSELLNLRQRNVHGTVAQGIAFIQPKSRSQARQP